MSWRSILAGGDSETRTLTHNSHNTHNSPKGGDSGNCAYIANCARTFQKQKTHENMPHKEVSKVSKGGFEPFETPPLGPFGCENGKPADHGAASTTPSPGEITDPGGRQLSWSEAFQAAFEIGAKYDVSPDFLLSQTCDFEDAGRVLWDRSPTRKTDDVSTGVISLYPDLQTMECVARLLARDGRPDTADVPLLPKAKP